MVEHMMCKVLEIYTLKNFNQKDPKLNLSD